jgi:RNA polymerase sigma-70 factor (ECF subfamily)
VTGFPSTARSSSDERAERFEIRPSLDQHRAAELFEQVAVPHLADALALARWLIGNPSDAEDIVQEACMRALKGIAGYRGGSARAWLLTIVRNTAFTWLARQRSSALVMVGDLNDVDELSSAGPAGAAPQPTPELDLIRRADERAIAKAIGGLSLPLREVLVLRDVNGFSYKEVAEVLSLPIGTVMSRLARGRQQLAVLLTEAMR